MKYPIHKILGLLVLCAFLSCGKNPCTECVDSNGTIEVTNSISLDWLYLGPNVFNSFEQSITVHIGGDFNDTPTLLTEIARYQVIISKGNNILIEQTELDLLSGNINSGYEINIPVSTVSESISKGSQLLDYVVSVTTDSEQSFKLVGKIQYINCDALDFDNFNAAECRWSCQLKDSGFGESNCVFCF